MSVYFLPDKAGQYTVTREMVSDLVKPMVRDFERAHDVLVPQRLIIQAVAASVDDSRRYEVVGDVLRLAVTRVVHAMYRHIGKEAPPVTLDVRKCVQ